MHSITQLTSIMYNAQRNNTKKQPEMSPNYSKADFREWLNNNGLSDLYAKWVGTRDTKPTVSRIHINKLWTLDNIILTQGPLTKKVTLRKLDGTFLKEYTNVREASEATGNTISAIKQACAPNRTNCLTAGGHIFHWSENEWVHDIKKMPRNIQKASVDKGMKYCTRCTNVLTLAVFSKDRTKDDGHDTRCKACILAISRTESAVILNIYTEQHHSSTGRYHPMPNYTLEEWRDWCYGNGFKKIYDEWVKHNYAKDMRPSGDKLDQLRPYTFDNLRLVTWRENMDAAFEYNKKIVVQRKLDGVYITEYESVNVAAEACSLSPTTMSKACTKYANGENTQAGGYRWHYKSDKFEYRGMDGITVPIHQFNKHKQYTATYVNMHTAETLLGYSKGTISKMLTRDQSMYIWTKEPKTKQQKLVYKLYKDSKHIASFGHIHCVCDQLGWTMKRCNLVDVVIDGYILRSEIGWIYTIN